MPGISLLCGLTGSGKSTWAAERAKRGSMVFCSDEWMIRLFGHHMPREVFDARLANCMELIFDHTNRLAALGVDVVIEGAFWKRADRQRAAQRLAASGAQVTLYWFDVPLAELRRRLALRNAAPPPDTFDITDAMLTEFAGWFEPPTAEERLRIARIDGTTLVKGCEPSRPFAQ